MQIRSELSAEIRSSLNDEEMNIVSLTKNNDYYVFLSDNNKRHCRKINEANVCEIIDDNAYLRGKFCKNFLKCNGPNEKDGRLVDECNCNCVRFASNKSTSNEAFYAHLVGRLPNTNNKGQYKVSKKSVQPTRKRLYLNRNCRRLSRRAFRCRFMRANNSNVKLKLLTYPSVAHLLFKYTLKRRRRRRYRASKIKAFDGNRKLTAKAFKCFKTIPHERICEFALPKATRRQLDAKREHKINIKQMRGSDSQKNLNISTIYSGALCTNTRPFQLTVTVIVGGEEQLLIDIVCLCGMAKLEFYMAEHSNQRLQAYVLVIIVQYPGHSQSVTSAPKREQKPPSLDSVRCYVNSKRANR
uniref:Uncharacterized protein n=1 Tax=Glossina pallidipes TaxID=7398 RepID=A0A1B0ADY7_GLOPL